MTIIDTDPSEITIHEKLETLTLKGRSVPRDPDTYKRELSAKAIVLIDKLREYLPHMSGELDEIELDICSPARKTFRFGLACVNRMVEHHNLRVAVLLTQAERKLTEQRMGLLSEDDPRRPQWLKN